MFAPTAGRGGRGRKINSGALELSGRQLLVLRGRVLWVAYNICMLCGAARFRIIYEKLSVISYNTEMCEPGCLKTAIKFLHDDKVFFENTAGLNMKLYIFTQT